ncbi:hypothetical protein JTE90_009049 [Oedothorax gibbosus]|uniref:Uncharacterized protein n=1 Tax=Oedothorax gibbosus TaxID=931172 RepID=A0AAV6VIP3_9ARAC|nr:hypothetical protein JTE90_009049 [Oedothorax gibbosus]
MVNISTGVDETEVLWGGVTSVCGGACFQERDLLAQTKWEETKQKGVAREKEEACLIVESFSWFVDQLARVSSSKGGATLTEGGAHVLIDATPIIEEERT